MCNIRDVHLKIKEMSGTNLGGRPHIQVNELAANLNISSNELKPLLDGLYSIAFIDYYKDCRDVVSLTDTGKVGDIPLPGNWQR